MEIAANYAYTLTANPLSRKCLVLPVMLAVGQEFWSSGSTPTEQRQTNVQFEIRNIGGTPTGPIEVQLPNALWLALASPSPMASLGPNENAAVVLTLSPAHDLPLGPYTGTIVLVADTTFVEVPFTFNNISNGVGDLEVAVADEFTFYGPGNPPVANATVTLKDPATNGTVASATTGVDGSVLFTSLPQATYSLEVRAENHQTFRGIAGVVCGRQEQVYAFLPAQVVTYSWRVDPIAVEDRYLFIIDAVFEANVPIPVVTVDPAFVDLRSLVGQTTQIDFTVTNHGLIAAKDVQAIFQGNDRFEITALLQDIGDLQARTSVTVPVIIHDRELGNRFAVNAAQGTADPCGPVIGKIVHSLFCDTLRFYETIVSWGYPDRDCGLSIPDGTAVPPSGGEIPPGSLGKPYVTAPSAPTVEPPCDCPKLLVVFFDGGYRSSDGQFVTFTATGWRGLPGEITALDPQNVRVIEIGNNVSSTVALRIATFWIAYYSLRCDANKKPKVMLVGHSLGGDTVMESGSMDADRRITADPIDLASIPCILGFRWYQRDIVLPAPPFTINALATKLPPADPACELDPCGGVRSECVFGHRISNGPNILIPNSYHSQSQGEPPIYSAPEFKELVRDEAETLLQDN